MIDVGKKSILDECGTPFMNRMGELDAAALVLNQKLRDFQLNGNSIDDLNGIELLQKEKAEFDGVASGFLSEVNKEIHRLTGMKEALQFERTVAKGVDEKSRLNMFLVQILFVLAYLMFVFAGMFYELYKLGSVYSWLTAGLGVLVFISSTMRQGENVQEDINWQLKQINDYLLQLAKLRNDVEILVVSLSD